MYLHEQKQFQSLLYPKAQFYVYTKNWHLLTMFVYHEGEEIVPGHWLILNYFLDKTLNNHQPSNSKIICLIKTIRKKGALPLAQ